MADSNRPCTMCYQSTANTLTSRPGSMKVEQSCVPVWRALAYLIQIKQKGLPHWQAAVAWWESRLQMTGPMGERTELCFFPASEATGLHNVHPTWAGTFVLAALGASFRGKHFFLSDSDCLPVLYLPLICGRRPTLPDFHWVQRSPRKMPHPLLQHQRFQHDCYVRDTVKVHPIKKWDKGQSW